MTKNILAIKVSVSYVCPKLKVTVHNVSIPISNFYGTSSDCESCGGHTKVVASVGECPRCGKYHEIEINSV